MYGTTIRNNDRNCFRIVSRTAATGSQEATAHLMAGVLIVAYAGVDGFVCSNEAEVVDLGQLMSPDSKLAKHYQGQQWRVTNGQG